MNINDDLKNFTKALTAWIEDDPDIAALVMKAPFVSRAPIC
jgi:hypothetical protein